ncbi:hypothetical protein SELMODRAFT_431484 [Selaginella moellendorffii]|uniref:Uncharacterized protein n=1 Tax=Selaginella moellendorffii TaxID=88036 RepID=D8TCT5_SELML|nr:hypothetical protein SELMODRAFT_431484 [Selaginella moellendorffii]
MAKNHRSSASLVLFFACMALGFSVEAARESFTYYWTVEESVLCGNEASNTEIKDCDGNAIASVCGGFSSKIHVEGAGRLKDGRYVNCQDNDCTCYFVTDGPKGSRENDLQLYVSIAVPDEGKYPFGSHLKIDLLQGLALPNGRQHNGCVRVDDACKKDKEKNNECNMDFYVGSESNYHNIEHELQDAESWDANIDPNCQIQDYGS